MRTNRLVVIDDEPQIAAFVGDVAGPLGFDVRLTSAADEFLELCQAFKPTVVVMDLQMPGTDGIELLEALSKLRASASVIVISGMDTKVLASAKRLGGDYGLSMVGMLQKPIMIGDLEALLRDCLSPLETTELAAEDLRLGLEAGQLQLYYQPILGLRAEDSAGPVAAEALLRWVHPEDGLLPPASFLHLMQSGGLTRQVTDYVLERAVQQLGAWRDVGLRARVSVNLDPELIDDIEFPDRLLGLLGTFDVEPASLVLEVTERGALARLTHTMNVLTRLRLKGIELAIDDFGTGNSSLIQLHRMPFSELKIDRSFVEDMTLNQDSRVIVQALVDMAHNLGMTTCAEGVETRATMKALIEMGCDRAQGFLIAKPMSAEDFSAWQHRRSDESAIRVGGAAG